MSFTDRQLKEAQDLVKKYGGIRAASRASGMPKSTLNDRMLALKLKKNITSRKVTPILIANEMPRKHLIIPDTQIRPGVPQDHLYWIAQAIVEYRPDVIIHLGDHWDFPSLNSHEKPGSLQLEGLRYKDDVRVGNHGFAVLSANMEIEEKRSGWKPEKHYIMGNHDIRPDRVAAENPKLFGTIGSDQCDTRDWKRHEYLSILNVDNILYSHFFQSSHSDRAIGGTIPNKLAKIGSSFCHGHVQGIDIGTRMMANGKTLWGASCGSAYLHEEPYRGAQGQRHFRGIIIFNEAHDGECCPMVLSLDYLCRKYEGLPLVKYMAKKYAGQSWAHLR